MQRDHAIHLRQRGEHRSGLGQRDAGARRQHDRVASAETAGQRDGERAERLGRQFRQPRPAPEHRIGGEAREAGGVGQDRQPVPGPATRREPGTPQRLCRREQILEPIHAQHAGAAQRRIHHRIGEPARIVEPRACADRHDRARARRGAGGGDELPSVLDAADVEQDRRRTGIARQPVQRMGEAEIGVAADADDVAEADALRLRPIQHRPRDRRGLRHQRQLALARRQVAERGVEPDPRHRHAEAALPQRAQPVALGQRGQVGRGAGDHHGMPAARSERRHRGIECAGRQGEDGEVRRIRQRGDVAMLLEAAMRHADEGQPPAKPARRQVARQQRGVRLLRVGDQRDMIRPIERIGAQDPEGRQRRGHAGVFPPPGPAGASAAACQPRFVTRSSPASASTIT
jgi:hypothetical protein